VSPADAALLFGYLLAVPFTLFVPPAAVAAA
jgi:hypothetical protein